MDVFSFEKRSELMSSVKNKNTFPERKVRSLLHRYGYRFRINNKKLIGCPDVVLPKYKLAVFIHGCFWHSHDCPRGKRPSTNQEFWNKKLDINLSRDRKILAELEKIGWKTFVIWECETRREDNLKDVLRKILQI